MFETKRDEVARGWRKLRKEEVHQLVKWHYGRHIKEEEIGGARSTHGNDERYVHIFSFIMETNRPVVRTKRRWGSNIKMYLKGIMCKDMGWIRLSKVTDQ